MEEEPESLLLVPVCAVRSPGEPYVEDDVAYASEAERNADPCTSKGCMWPKSTDGKVYVPYTISSVYCEFHLKLTCFFLKGALLCL